MSIPACAQTTACDKCGLMDCKFNTSTPAAPARTRISECEYINVNQARRPATPQKRVRKSQPRAQEGTAMGKNGKLGKETTRENVIAFIMGAIAYVKANSEYTGLHVKLSGFNGAFKQHFGVDTAENIRLVDDAVEHAKAKDGKTPLFFKRMAIQGPIIWLWADKPKSTSTGKGELDAKAKGLLASATK